MTSETHEYPTRDVKATELDHTMVLVGDSGGLSAIYQTDRSSAMPGFMVVETEHGMLYLDEDHMFAVYDENSD